MSQYGWEKAPTAIQKQIQGLTREVSALLGVNLVGVYLHGSLAMGCFNPARSDIDLLIVTHHSIVSDDWCGLAKVALRFSGQPRPLEFSSVPLSALRPWQYPTPYEFHYGEDGREQMAEVLSSGAWRDEPQFRTDPDLAAHITIIRHSGIVLSGISIPDAFPDVPRVDYLDSILLDFEFARAGMSKNPVYAILNFCRIYAYVLDDWITSKDEAGLWAEEHLPEYAPMIQTALAIYRGQGENGTFNPADLARFADDMAERIGSANKLA